MVLICCLIALCGLSLSSSLSLKNAIFREPKFPASYVTKGILRLPYAEINEPFDAYFDVANKRSRIDYYGGMVKTYQFEKEGEFGTSYKVAYMPDSKGVPVHTCFQVNGTVNASVSMQSILPDLTGFAYEKDIPCTYKGKNVICELWTLKNTVGNKVNKYSMLITSGSQLPAHYEMKGMNTLLGSHYDKYEIDYTDFTQRELTDDDFAIENGLECHNFPGPGVQNMVSNNPMLEFINGYDDHIHEAFDDFTSNHKKEYKTDKEHEYRKTVFRQNYRFVNSMNRAGLSYGLAINQLADFSDQELRKLRGRLPSQGYNGGKPFPMEEFPKTVPDFVDWRLFGAVTPVKDQAVCGSCWSFGTTGTIEGSYFRKTQNLVKLSQQQLIDCSWKFQNNGCDGGEDFRAYQYIIDAGGLATEDDYGSYLGADGICHDRNVTKTAKITGYINVTSGDEEALKTAIAEIGPISVSIDAAHKSFSFYSHGVFYEPECKNGADQLDHSVLAVGYGTMNGQDYWIVKNSWSTYWGNDGYVLMSRKNNNCGVETTPTYVQM